MNDNINFGSIVREVHNYSYPFRTWYEIFIEKPIEKEPKEFNMELKING